MRHRTEITVETHRVFVVRRPTGVQTAWCSACNELVEMITPDEGAKLAGISSRTIYRSVEAESIHFTETHDGSLLICLDSLHRSMPASGEAFDHLIDSTKD
jgi:hypothetical protein